MLKNKKATLIVGAIIFVVAVFFLKNQSDYKSRAAQGAGLAYDGNLMVQDLLNKDTDGDGVPDWQENLMGTDPTKKETTPGIPDAVAIQKIEAANQANAASSENGSAPANNNPTQTDKFSQELFSTVATLSQTGGIDQNTVDQVSNSVVSQLQNPVQRKVFTIADLNIGTDTGPEAIQKYITAINAISTTSNATQILQSAIDSNGDINTGVLPQLDPEIQKIKSIVDSMTKMKVPQNLAAAHLDLLNAVEKRMENLSDVELVDSDPVAAMSGMSAYPDATSAETDAVNKLNQAITQAM